MWVTFDVEEGPQTIKFDPCADNGLERVDLDIARWGEDAGNWPKPVRRSNAWKALPNRDATMLECHTTRGYPIPHTWILERECIAKRNLRIK